jgi:hypothetical protein
VTGVLPSLNSAIKVESYSSEIKINSVIVGGRGSSSSKSVWYTEKSSYFEENLAH